MATTTLDNPRREQNAPLSPPERRLAPLAVALSGSALLWAALPPLNLWPLGWLAPVPWIWLARQRSLGGRRPYAQICFAGFAFWLAALYWMTLPHWATTFGWL